mmetsp:Transcript_2283/g.8955  ORF Transcript_2283/g.8955 Transcript_2283/m.8955 type:complete len:545 (-) Transcript_2283:172-1806(-)
MRAGRIRDLLRDCRWRGSRTPRAGLENCSIQHTLQAFVSQGADSLPGAEVAEKQRDAQVWRKQHRENDLRLSWRKPLEAAELRAGDEEHIFLGAELLAHQKAGICLRGRSRSALCTGQAEETLLHPRQHAFLPLSLSSCTSGKTLLQSALRPLVQTPDRQRTSVLGLPHEASLHHGLGRRSCEGKGPTAGEQQAQKGHIPEEPDLRQLSHENRILPTEQHSSPASKRAKAQQPSAAGHEPDFALPDLHGLHHGPATRHGGGLEVLEDARAGGAQPREGHRLLRTLRCERGGPQAVALRQGLREHRRHVFRGPPGHGVEGHGAGHSGHCSGPGVGGGAQSDGGHRQGLEQGVQRLQNKVLRFEFPLKAFVPEGVQRKPQQHTHDEREAEVLGALEHRLLVVQPEAGPHGATEQLRHVLGPGDGLRPHLHELRRRDEIRAHGDSGMLLGGHQRISDQAEAPEREFAGLVGGRHGARRQRRHRGGAGAQASGGSEARDGGVQLLAAALELADAGPELVGRASVALLHHQGGLPRARGEAEALEKTQV